MRREGMSRTAGRIEDLSFEASFGVILYFVIPVVPLSSGSCFAGMTDR